MMILLQPDEYDNARALADSLDGHAAVSAVLAGVMPGAVYVDVRAAPRTLLIFPANRWRVYLAGDVMRESAAGVMALLRERYRATDERSAGEFLVHYAPDVWEAERDAVVGDMLVWSAPRRIYEFAGDQVVRMPLAEGFALEPISAATLAAGYVNTERMVDEIGSESPSTEYFLSRQGGVCVRSGDTLAGWCMMEYRHGQRCEVGIETLEPYRRRGLATAMVTALIERLLAEGVTRIGWHCWERNAGSIGVAERAGFRLTATHHVWYCQGPAQ